MPFQHDRSSFFSVRFPSKVPGAHNTSKTIENHWKSIEKALFFLSNWPKGSKIVDASKAQGSTWRQLPKPIGQATTVSALAVLADTNVFGIQEKTLFNIFSRYFMYLLHIFYVFSISFSLVFSSILHFECPAPLVGRQDLKAIRMEIVQVLDELQPKAQGHVHGRLGLGRQKSAVKT